MSTEAMGVVILGGLLSSTALNMLVVPALYARFVKRNGKLGVSPTELRYDDVARLAEQRSRKVSCHDAGVSGCRDHRGDALVSRIG